MQKNQLEVKTETEIQKLTLRLYLINYLMLSSCTTVFQPMTEPSAVLLFLLIL